MPALSGSQKALMQARYGIARYGATRYGYYTPNQVVIIGGVNRSTKMAKGTVSVTLNTDDVADTARFTVIPNPGFTPVDDQPVIIGSGTAANALFSGYIAKVNHRRRESLQTPWFDVECTDDTRALDGHLVTGAWENMDVGLIVIDILQRYATTFTYVNVQTGIQVISTFSALNEKVSSVIRRLATLVNGDCYWLRSEVHFYGPAGETGYRAPTAPRTITDTLSTLVRPAEGGELPWHAVDGDQKATRVIVDGKRTTTPVGTPDGATSTLVASSASVDYLIVAGGGAGGSNASSGGGGGGGGVVAGTLPFGPGAYAIVVGAGGATVGANGSDSSISTLVATGGGGGGGAVAPGHTNGSNGGSGGGGTEVSGAGGTGVAGQGNNGGAGVAVGGGNAGGGGGGAGAAGTNGGFTSIGGQGGAGVVSSVSGAPQYYGGGGGGNGLISSGNGGIGGGGRGGAGGNPSVAGTANTGGGGGGSSDNNNGRQAGGSGIVILRYQTGLISATGGTITTSGGYTIHTFTSNGTFTVSTITITAPIPSVSILPIEDASKIDPAGGTVLIGTVVAPYTLTLGPPIVAGGNKPGSTLSADVAVGATSLSVADVTQFTDSHGWVRVGEQIVYWDSKSAGALTGVPATGFGSVTAALKSGTAVQWMSSINLTSAVTFSPALQPGTSVTQRVIVDDVAAQAALITARGGGDGIIEINIDDDSLDVPSATQAGAAALVGRSSANILSGWSTTDFNALPNRKQAINRTLPEPLSVTLRITQVIVSWLNPVKPLRHCEGAIIRQPMLADVLSVNQR